ncbi:mechanosensitive ion channel family protein [Luteitalea sp. TBR-22]|uniref:mechanosensitive ion channel family protein n=1 Tax=Luteitalea sp. TBR-22 TaxID=2802971 RepID=UPI001EF70D9E|nr:mechanosensitive ion channel domain-containing protein [Luteitalea sp. TBR-22]
MRATLAGVIVLALAYLVAELVSRVLAALVERINRHVPGDLSQRKSTRAALRLVRFIITLLVAAVLIFPAMSMVGIESRIGLSPEHLATWLTGSGLRIALIALLAWLVVHVTGLVVRRLEGEIGTSATVDVIERAKRARTLGTLIQNTIYVLVSTISLLMILRELNVDITPILTGAGIVGLAVGFGAQSLVKDIISGFFLILEDQIRVGDVANIDGTGGLVERITLRTIILRDETGTVHVIPNGSIQRLSNQTKDFSFYVTSVSVNIREDTDRVTQVLTRVADGMQQDVEFAPFMLGPLEVLGVDRFNDAAVDVKMRLKTVPSKQWVIGREFLRRVKRSFEDEGIELPVAHRTLLVSQAPMVPPDPGPDTPPPS